MSPSFSPLCGRAGPELSILTTSVWRAATSGSVTGRPVIGYTGAAGAVVVVSATVVVVSGATVVVVSGSVLVVVVACVVGAAVVGVLTPDGSGEEDLSALLHA